MTDVNKMFKKQAAWQQARTELPWAEKLRQSLVLREARRSLKKTVREPEEKYPAGHDEDGHVAITPEE
ncbi:MAG TPA: hypothetical protein PKM67_05300 [Kiritimatiellia bacterium]|nr:hypothetical protein [Kiritimatiellia bacterium]HNS80854.1 hypothetical protein [Kiritimatiellia bacterium]HPA78801.1 hypothetical protein [Kiritimatiellia bacterium]HQQ05003.1 hypothetical protein [Kiritimatiellia bacterium]